MTEKMEIKHEQAFNSWLVKNGVKSKNYPTGLRTIQKKLNTDLDSLLKDGIEPALEKLTPELFGGRKSYAQDAVSHLKKYEQFLFEKTNSIPFKRRLEFEQWLSKEKQHTPESISCYVSCINKIQLKFRTDIDDFLSQGIQSSLKKITMRNVHGQANTVNNKRAMLKSYFEFTQSKN
jgi:hypothetical protein